MKYPMIPSNWFRYANLIILAFYVLLNLKQAMDAPLKVVDSSSGSSSTDGAAAQGQRNLQQQLSSPHGLQLSPGQHTIIRTPNFIRKRTTTTTTRQQLQTTETVATATATSTIKAQPALPATKATTTTTTTSSSLPIPPPPAPKVSVNRPTLPPPPSNDFAYVFYLGGVNRSPTNVINKEGLLYNILVSAQILKDSGSQADMVLLVHTVEPVNATLPAHQLNMLDKVGIRVVYTPDTAPSGNNRLDPTNYFGTVGLEKYRIFGWDQYKRILFLEADIMPHCNLDYLFHNSINGTLQPNVLLSMGDEPASSNIFMVQPQKDRYTKFLQMVASLPTHSLHRNRLQTPKSEWISLQKQVKHASRALSRLTILDGREGVDGKNQGGKPKKMSLKTGSLLRKWDFDGLQTDLGLLYAFMRFRVKKEVSIIVGDQVYTPTGKHNKKGIQLLGPPEPSPIQHQSCLPPATKPQEEEVTSKEKKPAAAGAATATATATDKTSQDYHFKMKPQARQWISPMDIAPYTDIAMWKYDNIKPWDPQLKMATSGAPKRWLKTLAKLERKYQFGIGLSVQQRKAGPVVVRRQHATSSAVTKSGMATSSASDIVANGGAYSSIPSSSSAFSGRSIVPLGSISHHATKVWAQQQSLLENKRTIIGTTALQLEEPVLTTAPVDQQEKPKRAFVCVTGQLERLELQNKIEKLFKPIQQRGYELDVALVVTNGHGIFTNHDRSSHQQQQSRTPFYRTYAKAAGDLKTANINVLSSDAYELMKDPPFHQQYYERLYESQKETRTAENQRERVLNHARIFDSYTRCYDYARQQAAAAAEPSTLSSLDSYYDVFMRIRDDVGFENALPEQVLSSLLQPSPGSVQVTGCRSWSGMNDRFASVSWDVAQIYFTRLYQNFLSGELPDAVAKVYNPETYLFSTFAQAGIHVLANRDLVGLSKIIMDPEKKGKPIFAPHDIEYPKCFLNDPHLDHMLDLYGWTF